MKTFNDNAGRTWTGGEWPGPWGTQEMTPYGDVNVAFDGRGVLYATSLAGNVTTNAAPSPSRLWTASEPPWPCVTMS